MSEPESPRVVTVPRPESHFRLIRNPGGDFLGVDGEPGIFKESDDRTIWDATTKGFTHVLSGVELIAEDTSDTNTRLWTGGQLLGPDAEVCDEGALFSIGHGPSDMPSEYLESLRKHGWVCLPCVLAPGIVDSLERLSCTGDHEDEKFEWRQSPLLEDVAVARTATEPVSLWVIRQYMQTNDVRLAHPPSFSILSRDDGKCDVQGWHSDFPYLWGIGGKHKFSDNRIPEHSAPDLVLGVQRNICVSEFTRDNGATIFKLGSHGRGEGPPRKWGNGVAYFEKGYREKHGLPYGGSDADLVEAPGGSIIVYDARTWHRAGVNRTGKKRAAMLQAVIPMYMMPFFDTSKSYRNFIGGPLLAQLDEHERRELESVMVNRMGQVPITVDRELTPGATDSGRY